MHGCVRLATTLALVDLCQTCLDTGFVTSDNTASCRIWQASSSQPRPYLTDTMIKLALHAFHQLPSIEVS